jgi:hypothetical protein
MGGGDRIGSIVLVAKVHTSDWWWWSIQNKKRRNRRRRGRTILLMLLSFIHHLCIEYRDSEIHGHPTLLRLFKSFFLKYYQFLSFGYYHLWCREVYWLTCKSIFFDLYFIFTIILFFYISLKALTFSLFLIVYHRFAILWLSTPPSMLMTWMYLVVNSS